MRQVVDSVTIEVEGRSLIPEIPDALKRPLIPGNIGGSGFDWMKVVREDVFGENVSLRVRAETQPDVTPGDAITDDLVLVALIKRKANRVFGDLVRLQAAAVG